MKILRRFDDPGAANEWRYSGIEPTKEAFLNRLDGLMTCDVFPRPPLPRSQRPSGSNGLAMDNDSAGEPQQ